MPALPFLKRRQIHCGPLEMGTGDCGNRSSVNSTGLELLEPPDFQGLARLVLQEFLEKEATQKTLGKKEN